MEIFPYFYGPVGVLLLINLILFAATAHELTCGLWKREVVKSNTERYEAFSVQPLQYYFLLLKNLRNNRRCLFVTLYFLWNCC